ncbi:MAG: coproporphyrinogen III oxidase family protein, partial [Gemmatimonadetes bacterium]|nr:coproporphyrinogen III oxidase family protein [Gemmatimonadota bacterium]
MSSVYVHAPFCARRCTYCDFAVSVRTTGDADEWLSALEAEWRIVEQEGLFSVADTLDTLYVGGGTPSLLGPRAMSGLAEIVGRERLGANHLEWTAEANPESFTPDVAEGWAIAGVNRLSLGAQSFHPGTLRWMGRLHGPGGPERALDDARRVGIDNVSVDLIFGLPPDVGRSWAGDLARVLDLDVPHVSLYGLTVESGTALGRAVREGRELPVDEEQYRDEFLLAAETLTAAGYLHYEVSNFARPGA